MKICRLAALMAVACAVLSCATAEAQYDVCRGRAVASYSYPAYVAPQAAYVAPTYQAHNYAQEVVLVPKAVKVVVSPDYYYSVADSYRDALLADAIAFRILSAQGAFSKEKEPAEKFVPRYKEPGEVRPPDAPARPMQEPQTSTEVSPALQKVVDNACLKCHAGGANGIDLSNLATVPEGKRWHAYALVNSGEMPKGGKAIADADVKPFYEWAKSARKR